MTQEQANWEWIDARVKRLEEHCFSPVKELTDEEIWDFINALCLDMGDYWELTERNAIPMIRAILRKASEK